MITSGNVNTQLMRIFEARVKG